MSLCDRATTTAVEFGDGKLMLGQVRTLDGITLENIIQVMGSEKFLSTLANADFVSLVNWTMVLNMTGILRSLIE